MEIFLNEEDWNDQYGSTADYVSTHQPKDGSEFTLVRATVYTATTYHMVDGKPEQKAIHFAPRLPA